MDGLLRSEFALVLRDSMSTTPRRHLPPPLPTTKLPPDFGIPCDMHLEPRFTFPHLPTSPTSPLPSSHSIASIAKLSPLEPLPPLNLPAKLPVSHPLMHTAQTHDVKIPISPVNDVRPLDVLATVSAEQTRSPLPSIATLPTSPVRETSYLPLPVKAPKTKRSKTKKTGRIFKCAQCPSTFSQQFNLNKHVRAVHERRRPFECHVCHAKFQQKSHRTMHQLAVHEKLRQFACDHCNASFSWRGVLKKHRKSIHGLDS